MYRYLLPMLLLFGALDARDNPFFPAEGMKDLPVTSSSVQSFDPLKRAAVTLPDSARVLKKVTVEYQNLDGSLGTRSIDLDHSVDWHLPLFVSQSYSATKDDNAPLPETAPATAKPTVYTLLADFGVVRFYQSGKTLKVTTSDPLLRHFMLVEPHRIVLDFKRDADFRSKVKTIKDGNPFKEIRIGNHNGYYRTVIELDGQYRYHIDQNEGYINIVCH